VRCDVCGAGVPAASRFCPTCGEALDPANAPTVAAGDAPIGSTPPVDSWTPMPGLPPTPPAAADSTSDRPTPIDYGRFPPGTILDRRYRIIGRIGRGGMGEVYRADDLRLHQPVAIKLLPRELARDARRLEQFHNEVRTARQVAHPNVCRVYDIGADERDLYLSMEFVDGEDLAASLRREGRFRTDRALDLARQICAGLAAVHDRGVVHRDLKPANIMLDSDGRVRLMDFGLAAIGATGATRDGTPAYMAPEQLDGRGASTKSDIYALGLVLYEIFTGQRAFTAGTFDELRSQQASGEITPPSEIVRGLDPRIEDVILRCLEPAPDGRPSSALSVSMLLPGSDPLAAALAAGETPSPELVAAAGGETAVLSSPAALGWISVVVVLLFAAGWWADLGTLVGQSDLRKPGVVLAERAEEIRLAAGGDAGSSRRAWGFDYDRPALAWYERHGGPAQGWRGLGQGRPPALRFWHRSSPTRLDPIDPASAVTRTDPPPASPGEAVIELDSLGRLLRLVALPAADAVVARSSSQPDWLPLFRYAGLDPAGLTEVSATRVPPVFADGVRAWQAPAPDLDGALLRVEAASAGNRVVAFEIIGPWAPSPDAPAPSSRAQYAGALATALVVAGLVVLMLWLAALNVRSGRADWRRAWRLALVGFVVELVRWLITPAHSADPTREVQRFLSGTASAFLHGGVFGAAYLGFEPYVRKYWPKALIGWTRVAGGRFRDPVVGRDLLVGVAWGLFNACLNLSYIAAPALAGWPSPPAWLVAAGPLSGTAMVLVTLATITNLSLVNGLVSTFVITLLRRLSTSLWVLVPASMIVFGLLGDPTYTIEGGRLRVQLFWIATAFVPAIVAIRYGLLAVMVAALASNLTCNVVFTLDPERAYFQASLVPAAAILSMALAGYRYARAPAPRM